MIEPRVSDDDLARALAPYGPLTTSAFRAHLDTLVQFEPTALADLALAFAASMRHEGAAREFHARVGAAIRSAVTRAGYSAAIADDATQEALIVMLVGSATEVAAERASSSEARANNSRDGTNSSRARDGANSSKARDGVNSSAALASYRGRAPLGAWAKTIALRIAARIHAAHAKFATLPDSADAKLAGVDELVGRGIRAELRGSVVGAFDKAAARLSMFDRELLRAVIVEGRGMDQLATEHGVHRATVARWLGRARQQLDDAMRAELAGALAMSESEVSSVLRTVHTSLVLPLEPLLRP